MRWSVVRDHDMVRAIVGHILRKRTGMRACVAGFLAITAIAGATGLARADRRASAGAPADGEWPMPAGDASATRYSPLAQIDVANAPRLRPVWSFSTGVLGGHEGQPLVVGDTMYVVTPWPNVLYAFDLSRPGYPLKWKFRPDVSRAAIGAACCDVVNRGAVYADGKIIYNLLDGHTIAVDAATGRPVWETKIASVADGQTVTMAPFVIGDRVIVGASGGEFGIYGWIKGLDLATGRVVWTGHNLGPDAGMLIRPGQFHPPYVSGAELGVRSWARGTWKHGGAPVWGWISYDPKRDLLYYGTGNAGPYDAEQRAGDNRWASSVLARRPENGALIWAYQFTPHDSWDYDATGAMILANLTIGGKRVPALVHFDKNGFAYTLDRSTGRVLVAQPFTDVTWAKSIDLATGRPVVNPAMQTGDTKGDVKGICPSLEGGVSPASPPAYSPRTHLFYTSTNNFCMDYTVHRIAYIKGTPYMGVSSPYTAGPGGHLGAFIAWDATTGHVVWKDPEPYPSWSGALVTAGDVAFYGTLDGWFKAVDARTGKLLYRFKVGSGVVGAPIAFRGPDGRQYLAIYAGIGGDWALLAGDTLSDDPTDLRAPNPLLENLASRTSQGGMVWIFGL